MWRVLVGLHKEVQLSFMLVGHTKFAPDWCFGLLKQRLRKTSVGCLNDLQTVVEQSAKANLVQLAGDQNGQPIVPIHDWAAFLNPHFLKVKNIKTFHHFKLSCDTPGLVVAKTSASGMEQEIKMLHDGWNPHMTTLPAVIPPPGLPLVRQQYLFEKIRPYCPESVRDLVCPKPATT